MERIKLTYDERDIRTRVKEITGDGLPKGMKTVVSIPCRFRMANLQAKLSRLGMDSIPAGLKRILERNGFRMDPKTGDWRRTFHGTAVWKEGDCEYNPDFGYKLAETKARVKAQHAAVEVTDSACMMMAEFCELFDKSADFFTNTFMQEVMELEKLEMVCPDVISDGKGEGR